MKNQFSTVLIILLSFTFFNCNTSFKKGKPTTNPETIGNKPCNHPKTNLNISILLDLSDRISYKNQAAYDREYLKHITSTFKSYLDQKPDASHDDYMQIFFEPNLNDNDINNIASNLKVHVSPNLSDEKFDNLDTAFDAPIQTLYNKAQNDLSTRNGADLYNFFQNDIKDNCIKSCHRNILIILTDGYLYHKDDRIKHGDRTSYLASNILNKTALKSANWKEHFKKQNMGFIKAQEDLSGLEILVLGIDKQKHKNPNTQEIIRSYWGDWFNEMNVQTYKIKEAVLPANMESIIDNFINPE
ncbi:hypothetical protein [Aquimarina rhabdastrellae]